MIPEWAKNGQGLPRGKLSAHLKQKLIYLDLLCLIALGAATARSLLIASEKDGGLNDPELYVSCGAWALGLLYDVLLDYLTKHEKKVHTLVAAVIGCVPRGCGRESGGGCAGAAFVASCLPPRLPCVGPHGAGRSM